MQFKAKPHIVETGKSLRAWNQWVHAQHSETVKLLVYEYGTAITPGADCKAFKSKCIDPLQTDRSGAVANAELQTVVKRLQAQWDQHILQVVEHGDYGHHSSPPILTEQHGMQRFSAIHQYSASDIESC